jgi:uncharacterized repeat protein (TIGR03803 family)
MRTFAIKGFALTTGAAAMLVGCGGLQPPIGAPGAMPQNLVTAKRAERESSGWSYRVMLALRPRLGAHPAAPFLYINGALYGTTRSGGKFRRGTVYSIRPNGAHSVLHSFSGNPDGAEPEAALIDVNGALYGTTYGGGASDDGTVFSIGTTGAETVIYSFTGGSDGAHPRATLLDVNGTLYGTTEFGGDSNCSASLQTGCGVIYSISTTGSEHVLHSFTGGSDGGVPAGGLLRVNGMLYGATQFGGYNKCPAGGGTCGVVYSISTTGNEKVLHRFKGGSDGYQPEGGLIDVKGKLYGATFSGGNPGCGDAQLGCGVVYGLSMAGTEKVLYRFTAGAGNGGAPIGDLSYAKGIFYGATSEGGQGCGYSSCGPGTIYSVSIAGAENVLYIFSKSNGVSPNAVIDVNGVLYGTTYLGGKKCVHLDEGGCGTVFALSQ